MVLCVGGLAVGHIMWCGTVTRNGHGANNMIYKQQQVRSENEAKIRFEINWNWNTKTNCYSNTTREWCCTQRRGSTVTTTTTPSTMRASIDGSNGIRFVVDNFKTFILAFVCTKQWAAVRFCFYLMRKTDGINFRSIHRGKKGFHFNVLLFTLCTQCYTLINRSVIRALLNSQYTILLRTIPRLNRLRS